MRIALIPPIQMLKHVEGQLYQLMLPQLVSEPYYSNKFKEFTTNGLHVILDNGAAEGEKISEERLINVASSYRVTEVAVPDVPHNANKTFTKLLGFSGKHFTFMQRSRCDWGYVAQGTSVQEAFDLVKKVATSIYSELYSVVFLPRLLIKSSDDYYARIKLAEMINNLFPKLEIHLFGASRMFPQEYKAAAKEAPFIRSMDTSQPFVYAYHGMTMYNFGTDEGPARPKNYFKLVEADFDMGLVNRNVQEMVAWTDK